MQIFSQEYRFFTSAIVGGCLPIALGVALAIKRRNEKRHVWVLVGDMAAEMGSFHECTKYAARNGLPITFVVEDNGLSTDAPTQEVWGTEKGKPRVMRYKYKRGFPHTGVGTWVTF
jgi:TPP-dependent pyruvate/acetoin dehydrogenase alpha subunit